MADRRALLGLIAGLGGLAFGVGAVVMAMPLLAVLAACCALLAGFGSILLLHRLNEAEGMAAGAGALVKLLDLPQSARDEAAALIDATTRLPDARFFNLAVDGRVSAARRHLWPVTLVLLEIELHTDADDDRARTHVVTDFADLMRRTLREADIACRLGPLTFGLVLEDTAEEGGVWTAERLQVALAQAGSPIRRLAAGVASYPTHGLVADEVLARAQAALSRACAADAGRGLGQVEVARADLG